jgi:hypothetical protein
MYKNASVSHNKINEKKISSSLIYNTKSFNAAGQLPDIIFNNKITALNVYVENSPSALRIVKNNRELLESFADQINIVDFVIKNGGATDDILNILDSGIENFVSKNNITYPMLYFVKMEDFEPNKTYIFDEKFDLKASFLSNVDPLPLKQTIVSISREKKRLKKLRRNDDQNSTAANSDEKFIGEFSDFLIVENGGAYDFPFFVILDSTGKKILFTNLNGEIMNMVELQDFCLPNRIKMFKKILYIIDLCGGEIKTVSLEKGSDFEPRPFAKSDFLIDARDFEFVGDNKIFVIKNAESGFGFFDLNAGKYEIAGDGVGKISNVEKCDNALCFFDVDNNILYSLNGEFKLQELLNFGRIDQLNNIDKFLMMDGGSAYFLSRDNNSVYFYDGKTLEERAYDDFLYSPKNIIIYRNMYYFLSDNFIQNINFFNNDKKNIYLSFSKYFKYHNLNKIIENEKIFLKNGGDVFNVANNINVQFNYKNIKPLNNSPSFLNALKIVDGDTLSFVKSFPLGADMSFINFAGEDGEKYLLYGKMFFRNSEADIGIKKIYKIVSFNEKYEKNMTLTIDF